MPAIVEHAGSNLYRVRVSGLLTKDELTEVEAVAVDAIRQHGTIKLLFVLDAFEGWERTERWSDLGFYLEHERDIERIAIVADERWHDEALMFAAAGQRRAPVKCFGADDEAGARAWLASQ